MVFSRKFWFFTICFVSVSDRTVVLANLANVNSTTAAYFSLLKARLNWLIATSIVWHFCWFGWFRNFGPCQNLDGFLYKIYGKIDLNHVFHFKTGTKTLKPISKNANTSEPHLSALLFNHPYVSCKTTTKTVKKSKSSAT